MPKKKKKKSTLTEIKKLEQQRIKPQKLFKFKLGDPNFLEPQIKEFRGGQEGFEEAFNQFLTVYESAMDSCQDLRHQIEQQPEIDKTYFNLMLSRFQSIIDNFWENYSLDERKTLATLLMIPESAKIVELYNQLQEADHDIYLTEEQLKTCLFFWFNYQLFPDYLILAPDFAYFLWQSIDEFFFSNNNFLFQFS